MKKEEKPWVPSASTRDYLLALFYFPNFLTLLNAKDKPYEKLLTWFMDKENQVDNEDYSLPNLGALGKVLGLSSTKLTHQIKTIYDDVISLNHEKPELFKNDRQILCYLSFKYMGNYASMYLGMNVLPRKGDYFNFFFVKPKLDCSSFHISSVRHEMIHSGHTIHITLASGEYNSYLHLLKEKAYLFGHLTTHEYFTDEIDYKTEGKLIKEVGGL